MKIKIEIDNITEGQARGIEDLMALCQKMGEDNVSRWVAFFADGAGNFKPNIKIDGLPARRFIPDIGPRWGEVQFVTDDKEDLIKEKMYLLDFDRIDETL